MARITKLVSTKTEAAQRRAMKLLIQGKAYRTFGNKDWEIKVYSPVRLIAVFDLRDCYQKRQPLSGISKRVRAAVQPRGKRK